MENLQLSFWIAGWIVIGLVSFVFICSTIASSIKQIITHFYSTKKAYAQALLDMEAPGSLVKMVEDIAKKHQDKLVGKDS